MGKVFSINDSRQSRTLKCKEFKYLKPGAHTQHRLSKALTAKACTDLGKKGMPVLDNLNVNCIPRSNSNSSPSLMHSPLKANSPITELMDAKQTNYLMETPKVRVFSGPSESMLESLPIDLLVEIVCHLHHDQLKPAFHVCQRLRKAVVLARQSHFNYMTPDRSRQEAIRVRTPVLTDRLLNRVSSPQTPKAPRPASRPPSRLRYTDMRHVAAVLFQETPFPRYMIPSAMQRPPCKPLASHRVLFSEDELCQAVAQNKLR